MTVGLLELGSRMSFGVQTVQHREGDTEAFQSTSHRLQFLVGAGSALLVASLCYPFAQFFGVPSAVGAFALLAFIPLLKAVEHLDVSRFRRTLNFGPSVACEAIPQVIVTLAAWPLATWLPDYRSIVVLMLAKSALTVGMTHALAERPYRWGWDPAFARGIFAFSWPLILNGFLLFLSQGADQMLVGAFLSLSDLATFSVAFSIVSIPWFVAAQVSSTLMLPILAPHQNAPAEFRRRYRLLLEGSVIAALVLIGPLVAAGGAVVALLYGPKYQHAGPILAVLGATCVLRFLRLTPAIGALARGDTINQLASNIARTCSFPIALGAAILTKNMLAIAAGGLIGEAIAGAYSFVRLRRTQGIPFADNARPVLALLAGLVCAALGLAVCERFPPQVGVWVALPYLLSAGVLTRLAFPATHALLLQKSLGAFRNRRVTTSAELTRRHV